MLFFLLISNLALSIAKNESSFSTNLRQTNTLRNLFYDYNEDDDPFPCNKADQDKREISSNSFCKCKKEYATIKSNNSGYCSYTRKKQLIAFLLEMIVGFGSGHFYTERYLMASLKLVAFLFAIFTICLFPLTAQCVSDRCNSDFLVVFVSVIFYLCVAGCAVWYIWDLVYFGKNKYNDGKGVKLLSWKKN